MQIEWGTLLSVAFGGAIALLGTLLSNWLQQKAFVRQGWWELKRQAYSEIVAALADLEVCLEQWLRDLVGEKELDDKSRKEANEMYRQQKTSLKKAAATGAFIVSEDTITTLEQLLRDLDREAPNTYEMIAEHYGAVASAKAEVREYAIVELHKSASTKPRVS